MNLQGFGGSRGVGSSPIIRGPDQGLKSIKILRAIRVDLNIYDITPKPSQSSITRSNAANRDPGTVGRFVLRNRYSSPLTCPSPLLYGSHTIIFLRTKVFFQPSYRDSLVCNSCANLARRSQQLYKQIRKSRSGYHSIHGTRHRFSYL